MCALTIYNPERSKVSCHFTSVQVQSFFSPMFSCFSLTADFKQLQPARESLSVTQVHVQSQEVFNPTTYTLNLEVQHSCHLLSALILLILILGKVFIIVR